MTGTFHSIACTENGKVKTWGFGGNGRLGHTDQTSWNTPNVVEKLAKSPVSGEDVDGAAVEGGGGAGGGGDAGTEGPGRSLLMNQVKMVRRRGWCDADTMSQWLS
jgi:hypothetical protein